MQNNIEKINNYDKTNLAMFSILEQSINILTNKMSSEIRKIDDSFDLLDIAVSFITKKFYK